MKKDNRKPLSIKRLRILMQDWLRLQKKSYPPEFFGDLYVAIDDAINYVNKHKEDKL